MWPITTEPLAVGANAHVHNAPAIGGNRLKAISKKALTRCKNNELGLVWQFGWHGVCNAVAVAEMASGGREYSTKRHHSNDKRTHRSCAV